MQFFIISESAMGISLNSQNDLESDYVRNVNEWVMISRLVGQ